MRKSCYDCIHSTLIDNELLCRHPEAVHVFMLSDVLGLTPPERAGFDVDVCRSSARFCNSGAWFEPRDQGAVMPPPTHSD
jgi:hypothetical protein